MVICPVAIAVGCKKCPVFKICPATSILGDQKKAAETDEKPASKPASKTGSKTASGKGRKT